MILPHEVDPSTEILSVSTVKLLSINIRFKLRTIACDVNQWSVLEQQTKDEMKLADIDKLKSLDINQWLQIKYVPITGSLLGVRIEKHYLVKKLDAEGD